MDQGLMRFKSAFIKDGEMWCVPTVLNWLFRINLKDWSVKSVCDLELGEGIRIDYIYPYQDSVWCITAEGVNVVAYNSLTDKIEHYRMAGEEQRRNRGTVLFRERLWIPPIELPGKMISFDLIKKKFTVHDNWKKECQRWQVSGRAVSFCHVENTIYMTLRDECKVIQFNMETEGMEVKALPGQCGLWGIFAVQNNIYVTSFLKRELFQWNKNTGNIQKFYCPYRQDKPYARGLGFGNKILLMDDETVDIFDIKTEKITSCHEVENLLKGRCCTFFGPLFFIHMAYGRRYFLIPWNANALLEFDGEKQKWTSHMLRIPEKLFFKEYVVKKISVGMVWEGELLIEDLINYVIDDHSKRQEQKLNKQIGGDIYRCLVRDI